MAVENNKSTRDRILKVAKVLFHKQGFNETGINQIIAEAKVAKASLYYHFPTKDDLGLAYLNERHKEWQEDFDSFLEDKDDKIAASFDALIKDNEENNFRGCSFINMLSQTSPEKTTFLEVLQRHKLALQNFFADELEGDNPDLAYQVYSLFENAIIESQLFKSQEPVKRIQKIVMSLINNSK